MCMLHDVAWMWDGGGPEPRKPLLEGASGRILDFRYSGIGILAGNRKNGGKWRDMAGKDLSPQIFGGKCISSLVRATCAIHHPPAKYPAPSHDSRLSY